MTLAVIGRRLCEPLTGVGRYLEAMLRHWPDLPSPFSEIRVLTPAAPRVPADIWRPPLRLVTTPTPLPPLAWENTVAAWQSRNASVVFGPYTLPIALARRGVVSNLGIYEGLPGEFSALQRARTTPFFRSAVRRARSVIANSESTRRDIATHLGGVRDSIHVVFPGVDPEFQPTPRGRDSAKPYFLLVGKLSRRRNVPALLEAFAAFHRDHPNWRLIIAGPDTSAVDVPLRARQLGIATAVDYHPYLERTKLIPLYQRASAFVLPSAHEGFSFTILEAMACGAPIVTIPHASLEAGVREAAHLCPAAEEAVLESSLRELAASPAYLDQLRERSLACAANFSWRQSAEQTLAVLARAAQSR